MSSSTRLLAALFLVGCGPQEGTTAEEELDASALALTLAPGTVEQVLAVVNDPGTTLATLDGAAGLDARAAKGIIARRNGADGDAPSADDLAFASIGEVDAVPYVGDAALQKLVAYAKAHPAAAAEMVEGVSFKGWESASVVWGVNNAPAGTLDGMLDARAARALLAARPFTSVSAMGPVAYVGPSALDRLRREAATWFKAQRGPQQPATLAQVKAALETATADLWMPSETDAHFVWLQGTSLNGAPVSVSVVRAQLTAQHDALIAQVMYTDPSERSLAAKTQVEERSAVEFFNHIIGGVDVNDPASIEMGHRFEVLRDTVMGSLTDVKVYRFGRISISTFIVGRAPSGELVGLLTGQVET